MFHPSEIWGFEVSLGRLRAPILKASLGAKGLIADKRSTFCNVEKEYLKITLLLSRAHAKVERKVDREICTRAFPETCCSSFHNSSS